VRTIVAPDLGGETAVTVAEDLISLLDQTDGLQATLLAMDRLAQLYPDTFRMLLLAAWETLRPTDIEARLDGQAPAPIAVRWEP
jgi:hypothetical protein